jgi:predicted dehydrogenase
MIPMADKLRCLMIGAGGMAGAFCRTFFPQFADRMVVTGLVDINPEALALSGDALSLPASARFTDMTEAFAQVDADFCCIVIPPAFHKRAVLLATARKLDILSEKPIADTWDDCREIYGAVKAAGVKMQVVQNYRYNATMRTMKQVLAEQRLGRLNYVMGRFAADYRVRGAWGMFRHEIPHGLLVEGSVHHFDMLRNLTGADCQSITGWDWNPAWSSFDGESSGHFLARMTNGVVANYEGNCNEAGTQSTWHQEFYRAECEGGAVTVDRDLVVRTWEKLPSGLRMEEVPLVRSQYEGHLAIVDQFLTWKEGGPAPETVLDDNIQSAGMLFGAIMASEENRVVDVAGMVGEVNDER